MENDFELEQVSVRLVKDSPLYSDERIITAESAVKIIGKELMTQLDREQIGVFLVAEDLAYWVNTNYTTIYLTNDEAELILRYMDREGYNLGVDDDELIRIKSDTDEIEKYNLEDAIYSACDISEKRIKSLEEEIKNPRNFMTLCEVRQMLKAARKEEKIIDGMFKKTSLGRMVGLKPEEKTKKEKQKENNMHGH